LETFISFNRLLELMNNQSEVLSQVFDDKTVKILENILEKKDIIYIRELAKQTGVSLATTFRIIQHFLELGLVQKEIRGKFNFYKVKKDSPLFIELSNIILGKKINILDIIKKEVPEKKVFQNKKNSNEFFIISNEDIDLTKIQSEVQKQTGSKTKINVLSEN